MALSKESLYLQVDRRTSKIAKAISHPARLTLLYQLKKGPLDFFQLLEDHPLSQSGLSQHLRCLRNAGLVKCESIGRSSTHHMLIKNHPEWLSIILSNMDDSRSYAQAA